MASLQFDREIYPCHGMVIEKMVLLNIARIITFLLLFFSLFVCYKTHQHRRNKLFIVSIRPSIRFLSVPWGIIAIIVMSGFLYSYLFISIIVAAVITVFSLDIVVEEEGIYYGVSFLPWESILEVDDRLLYLMIMTTKWSGRKGFIKVLWKITAEDVKNIQTLLESKKRKR